MSAEATRSDIAFVGDRGVARPSAAPVRSLTRNGNASGHRVYVLAQGWTQDDASRVITAREALNVEVIDAPSTIYQPLIDTSPPLHIWSWRSQRCWQAQGGLCTWTQISSSVAPSANS